METTILYTTKCRAVAVVIIAILVYIIFVSNHPYPLPTDEDQYCEIRVRSAAVATDQENCSKVGKDMLAKGGNAVDAAVAAAFCLGVVSPASSGIGGGNFMVIRMADGRTQAYNMREKAPQNATQDLIDEYSRDINKKRRGPLSVAVPGEVKGLYEAWRMYGKLKWSKLVKPAEDYARNGFPISPNLYTEMQKVEEYILQDPGLSAIFTDGKNLLPNGTIVRNVKLADTLHAIGEEGPDVLYKGRIGEDLAQDIQDAGGILTKYDLGNYMVNVTKPLQLGEFMGMKLLGMPLPSSGGVGMMLLLNILAQYGSQLDKISYPLGLHRFIEACKHMFAVRTNLGDPAFESETTAVVSDMLSPTFAAELQKNISDCKTYNGTDHYGGKYTPYHHNLSVIDDHGTSHMSIIDSERNAVALTCTINNYFGAVFLSRKTGILLNNEMDDFSLPTDQYPDIPNYILPNKKPLSSMSPTIILKDGQLKGVIGGSGGSTIIAGTTQAFLHHFVGGFEPLAAIKQPRFFHMLMPDELHYENTTSAKGEHFLADTYLRSLLEERGHNVSSTDFANKCQFIVQDIEHVTIVDTIQTILSGLSHLDFNPIWALLRGVRLGELTAVSDPRKGGIPRGY